MKTLCINLHAHLEALDPEHALMELSEAILEAARTGSSPRCKKFELVIAVLGNPAAEPRLVVDLARLEIEGSLH